MGKNAKPKIKKQENGGVVTSSPAHNKAKGWMTEHTDQTCRTAAYVPSEPLVWTAGNRRGMILVGETNQFVLKESFLERLQAAKAQILAIVGSPATFQ